MHHGGVIRLEYQEFRGLVFRTIDREIVEAYSFDHLRQRSPVARHEQFIEPAHEDRLFAALAFAEHHARVEIPDVPLLSDRHVTGIWPAIDHNNSIFAKQAVAAGIINEAGKKEFLLRSLLKISSHCGTGIDLGKANAGMGSTRPD